MELETIKVFAPATIANVGCGYDILGFALEGLGEEVVVKRTQTPGLRITSITGQEGIPSDPGKNVATIAARKLLDAMPGKDYGFEFGFHKYIFPGSGLGTSASSAAGAVFAINHLLGSPFGLRDLVKFAMAGEAFISGKEHADNVAPAILGGFVVIRGYDPLEFIRLPYPDPLFVSIVHPQIEVRTIDAKRMLPREIPLENAVTQWGNVAGMISGLYSGNYEIIGRSMQDVVAEPFRSTLIPAFAEVKSAALEAGALGCTIAGSGPSVFAFAKSEPEASAILEAMNSEFLRIPVETRTYISRVGDLGVRKII